jgi:hypothetical protein
MVVPSGIVGLTAVAMDINDAAMEVPSKSREVSSWIHEGHPGFVRTPTLAIGTHPGAMLVYHGAKDAP